MFKKQPNKFDIRQFLVLLYDCVPSMKNYYSIGRLVKNLDVLEAETVKTPNTVWYSETKQSENFLNQEI